MNNDIGETFTPLDQETRVVVDTAAAAHHLNRRPQTLRAWACHEDGPIRPVRIYGRLAWRVSDLRRVLGCQYLKTGTASETDTGNFPGII